ncbi:TolC family protein [Helicobacter cappadocius]|uniref:TolC family protein n=1 Tax=Helicobacter cappadocius TaxID=3063998 RepID=A0AA90Q2P8_9HELI|nr:MULTISPECIES: TolC family protein [unclassified Helicobacter]MDO7252987.1 TolC family protein [Helicobacter sp. faydin-H75]MDP2539023.1 TolC family protein [Helicobacter sp. faydin-H76]
MRNFFLFCLLISFVFAQDDLFLNINQPIVDQPISEKNLENIDIKNAWEKVLNTHSGIKSAEFGASSASKLSTATKLSFLPSIDISALYLHLDKPIGVDVIKDKAAVTQIAGLFPPLSGLLQTIASPIDISKQDVILGALNIIYPLYLGGARIYASKIASLEAKDAFEAYRLKKLATFEDLIKIYYGVVLNQDIVKVLKSIEEGHYTHYQNALKMQNAGQIARIEVLSAQVAYDRAKTKTRQAEDSLQIAQLSFDSILGVKQQKFYPSSSLSIDMQKRLPNVDFFVNETLLSYPALKTLSNKSLIAKEYKKLQISKFLPQVGFFGSYIMKENNSILNNMIPNWYVGIGARLPIITPGGRIHKYEATRLAELQVNALNTQAIKDMKLLAQKTYQETVSALQEYKSLDSSIELAKENLKLQEEAFKQGIATSSQVIDSRNALSSVLIEQKVASYRYITLLASLMALSGHLEMFYEYQK